MTIAKLKELLSYAEKMENGIDPTTGLSFEEDTILNSKKIKEYNANVAVFLREVLSTTMGRHDRRQFIKGHEKIPYFLNKDEKETFEYSPEPLSISALAYQMNEYCPPYMKKVHASDVTKWLEEEGYLETQQMEDGRNYKTATKKGNKLGIENVRKKNDYGNEYSVNLYNCKAQKFIVENIEDILIE